jgi:hypothetical protein
VTMTKYLLNLASFELFKGICCGEKKFGPHWVVI